MSMLMKSVKLENGILHPGEQGVFAQRLAMTRSVEVEQIQCLHQDLVLVLLLNSVNLNITYHKINRINLCVSFGNINCLLMHLIPDIFH